MGRAIATAHTPIVTMMPTPIARAIHSMLVIRSPFFHQLYRDNVGKIGSVLMIRSFANSSISSVESPRIVPKT